MTEPDHSREDIDRLGPWFHNLHLPDGRRTVPDHFLGDFPSYKWQELQPFLPTDLSGATVLDVGCNAGFYSLELARRGASVTAIDSDPHYLAQAHWARALYGLEDRIELHQMQVYDLGRTDWPRFDLVLFLGVFYHLRYPLLGLDTVARCTGRQLFFQTLTMPGDTVYPHTDGHDFEDRTVFLEPGWPVMAFIEHRFADDPSNWWAPNHAAVEAILRSAGLQIVARPGREVYICRPGASDPAIGVELHAALGNGGDK